jgi:O-antigen/teichoic acid export membrane protein
LPAAIRSLFSSARAYASDPTHRIILRGAFASVSVRIAGVALGYAANVVLSRLLGLSEFGKYAIALSWALVLALPAKAGFDISSLRYATSYIERGDAAALRGFIHVACATVILISLIMGALVLAVGGQFVRADWHMLAWTALMIMPLALLVLFSVLMRVVQHVIASQFYDQMLRPFLVIAGVGAAAMAGIKLTAADALLITTLTAAGALVFLLIHFRAVYSGIWRQHAHYGPWRQWFAVSAPMLVMGVVQEMMNHVEVILLGVLGDARQAGLFAASWRLASFVPFVFLGLATMAGPLIATAYERRDFDEMNRVSTLVARLGFVFAAVGVLVLLAFGNWLLGLFGSDFVAGYPVLATLLLGGVVNAFTGIVGYLMILTGRERQALAVFAGALLLGVILNLILIPRWGALGAAAASSSATAAWNFAMLVYVRRTLGIDASALALRPVPAGKRT